MNKPTIREREYGEKNEGRVGYEVTWWAGGKRHRKSFPTREKAQDHASMVETQLDEHGAAAFKITEEERVEALRLIAALARNKLSLRWLLDYFEKELEPFLGCPPVSKIAEQVIEAKKAEVGERQLRDMIRMFRNFCEHVGDKPLAQVTRQQVSDFCLNPAWAANTQSNHIMMISVLYKEAMIMGYVKENLAKRVRKPKIHRQGEPGIVTVPQASRLLKYANEFGLLKYIAIALFAGLRNAELMRLHSSTIRLDVMPLRSRITKTGLRRVVEIRPVLQEWLGLCPAEGWVVDTRTFQDQFRKLLAKAGIEKWPHNALRHSCASYSLALDENAAKVAYQLGHSEAMLKKHYLALVTKEEAKKYFGLRPDTVLDKPDMADEVEQESEPERNSPRAMEIVHRGDNPFRPGTLPARMFAAGSCKPVAPPYLQTLSERLGMPVTKIRTTYYIVSNPNHKSNCGRCRVEQVNGGKEIRFISTTIPPTLDVVALPTAA